jgi:hypothetical protein
VAISDWGHPNRFPYSAHSEHVFGVGVMTVGVAGLVAIGGLVDVFAGKLAGVALTVG